MQLKFYKYQAHGNDFIIFDSGVGGLSRRRLPRLAKTICERRTGVGADGILWLSASRKADCRLDTYNADGSWAEKSGNGLRIAALHLARKKGKRRLFRMETATSVDNVRLIRKLAGGYQVRAELGCPEFESRKIPVRSRHRYVVNTPLRIGKIDLPVTCVAVGNPHAVVLVKDFEFDWQALGAEMERTPVFPNGINVEFVQLQSSRKLKVVQWERGAGATGSSGTGAAAAVCAMVMLGLAKRTCEVRFQSGSVEVNWRDDSGIVELTGPVQFVMEGKFDFR